MKRVGHNVIQTIEWKAGMPVSTGVFTSVSVLHCVDSGDVTCHFPTGDETRSFITGDDFSLDLLSVTIVSGLFDIN